MYNILIVIRKARHKFHHSHFHSQFSPKTCSLGSVVRFKPAVAVATSTSVAETTLEVSVCIPPSVTSTSGTSMVGNAVVDSEMGIFLGIFCRLFVCICHFSTAAVISASHSGVQALDH